MDIPLNYTVEVYRLGEWKEDRFGNLKPGVGQWVEVPVFQWWVHKTEEESGESVLRTIDVLTVHFHTGSAPDPAEKIRLPNGSEWQVEGNAEDYNHGWHGWSPGLVAVNCKGVQG